MRNAKKTKIVATLGPSTNSKTILRKMIKTGVNVFRLNFSHAKYEDVEQKVKWIRSLSEELNMTVGILADLQGPKLRIEIGRASCRERVKRREDGGESKKKQSNI